ncbi:hypothetical protein FSP39_025520 [Pinctada imbricata]|uniref:Uncharacterized protein n=1 Tax=Pinctada imbricata TaxID=66713 RepID=A0AA89C7N5_PINIB|nr:hypothetical protein FSP39_025520 [Pinctada imbricata]
MSSKYLFSIACFICFTHESHSSTCMSDNDVGNIGCVQIGSEFSHPQNAVCIKTTDEFMCRNAGYCWLSCVHAKYGRSKGHVPQDCRCKDKESDTVRRSHIDISCFRPDGKGCDWYVNCLEKFYPCEQDDNRYAISYAKNYCEKYGANYNAFSPTGKRWVDATRKCLQRALVPLLMKEDKPSCAEIKETAFLSHASCYAKPSSSAPSFCELSGEDVSEITKTINSAFFSAFGDSIVGFSSDYWAVYTVSSIHLYHSRNGLYNR